MGFLEERKKSTGLEKAWEKVNAELEEKNLGATEYTIQSYFYLFGQN